MNTLLYVYLKKYRWIIIILLSTTLVYLPSLKFSFYPNLDDGRLILNNPVVTDFPNHIKAFFTEFVYGLYHPLTTWSFIIDYQLFETNPFGYRLHNLLLHLLNTALVFFVVKKLTKKQNLSLFAASIFALHPMHMESVIWISERKDVLFTFYFLLSLGFYIKYKEDKKNGMLVLTFLFFVFSCLAKATAVVIPLLFILIDYYHDGQLKLKIVLNKWYLLTISVIFGIINIKAQNSIDFIQPIAYKYSLGQLITIPVYSFTWYLVKLFAPIGLAAKHLYPRIIDGQIANIYYTGWFWLVSLVGLTYYNRKNRLFVFGIAFYAISIGLLIKIIPTGNDIVSERYAYVPYIGLSLSLGSILIPWVEKQFKHAFTYFFIFIMALLSVLTWQQKAWWKDEIAIWSRVVALEPEMPLAYFERGKAYQNNAAFDLAIADFSQAINFSSNFYDAYINRGLCHYFNRNNEGALSDFSSAIKLEPETAEAFYHRGNLLLKTNQFELSVADFEKSIALGFEQPEIYYYKGLAEQNANRLESSITSLVEYQRLNPKHTETLYLIANSLARMEKYTEALFYYNQFIDKNNGFAGAYLNRGNVFLFLNDKQKACDDWHRALELGSNGAQQMLEQHCN